MRLRNIPGANEIITESPYCIQNPEDLPGKWNHVFQKDQPLHLEIGMGKGQFLIEMAKQHPNINYLGMERYASVLLRAVQKIESSPFPFDNLRMIRFDAKEITEIFAPGELDRIYLNFSDPWPKDRHAKRRLTSAFFLEKYHQILSEQGRIEFKTDNRDLFDFSLEEIKNSQIWHTDAFSYDLHHDPQMNPGNVMTEYECKFSSKGNPICKLICSRNCSYEAPFSKKGVK